MLIIFDLTRAKSRQTTDKATKTLNFIHFNCLGCGMDSLDLGQQEINLVLSI